MNRIVRRLPQGLLAAALALSAGSAVADTYRIEWNYKWSWGYIDRTVGIADSDPSPTRDVFEGAIDDYDFNALWGPTTDLRHFEGEGGTLVLDEQPPNGECVPMWRGCQGRTATLLFGPVFDGDPTSYRMVISFPWIPPGDPVPPLDWPEGAMSGLIYGSGSDALLGSAMSMYFFSSYGPLPSPVPEPGTWALGLLGALLVGLRGRAGRRAVREAAAKE